MLPRAKRLRTNEVKDVFAKGRLIHGPLLTLKYLPTPAPQAKYAFLVSKKTAKTAVSRNALRRKGYAALRRISTTSPHGILAAFTIKQSGKEVTVAVLASEIAVLLKKTGL